MHPVKGLMVVVVGTNCAPLLKTCLPSVSFAARRLYIDLGSVDNSVEIAQSHAFEVLFSDPHEIVEKVHFEYRATFDYEWILFIDPDEAVSPNLRTELITALRRPLPETTGAIRVPWTFFLGGRRLLGSPWGWRNSKLLVFRESALVLSPIVHRGKSLKPGYAEVRVGAANRRENLRHNWAENLSDIERKHKRYLLHEPPAKEFCVPESLRILYHFLYSFVWRMGVLDGPLGFRLSLLWANYQVRRQHN